MAADFRAALMAEIAFLEGELQADERYIKLEGLRRIAGLYPMSTQSQQTEKSPESAPAHPEDANRYTGTRKTTAVREQALHEAKTYVLAEHRVVPTRDIHQHLLDKGINVGGESPQNNLSALISKSGIFVAHGRSGWTVLEDSVSKSLQDIQAAEDRLADANMPDPVGISPDDIDELLS